MTRNDLTTFKIVQNWVATCTSGNYPMMFFNMFRFFSLRPWILGVSPFRFRLTRFWFQIWILYRSPATATSVASSVLSRPCKSKSFSSRRVASFSDHSFIGRTQSWSHVSFEQLSPPGCEGVNNSKQIFLSWDGLWLKLDWDVVFLIHHSFKRIWDFIWSRREIDIRINRCSSMIKTFRTITWRNTI